MIRDTLLIVDDSELDLAILNEIFKGIFRVECCQEANQALSFIQKNAERICAALVDICLGRRGAGFTLLHRLQTNALTTQLPIILITSDASRDNVMNGVEHGAVDFLVKPVDPHSVQERVCSIVRSAWPENGTILDQRDTVATEVSEKEELPAQADISLLDGLPERLSAEQAAQLVNGWCKKNSALCAYRTGIRATPSPAVPRLTERLAAAWRLQASKWQSDGIAGSICQASCTDLRYWPYWGAG